MIPPSAALLRKPSLWLWVTAFAALIAYVVIRIDLFPLTSQVTFGDRQISLPRAFFTVDHPFHTARAELLRSSWASLDTVRWVASHQGGYPAEFYPFGVQGVAAALSLISFGTLSVESAWAITIVAIFLLPGLAFLLISREDALSPAVALVALAGQIAIASDWTHGGYTELVEWGLATNVAGATYALVALPLLVRAVQKGSPRWAALAGACISLCAVSNPRSLIAIAVIAVAVLLGFALDGHVRRAALVVGSVAVLSAGLAAPVLAPLVRYRDLYFFLSYQEYAGVGGYWHATVDAVTWPILLLAATGVVLAFLRREHRATRIAAIAVVLYIAITALAAASPALRELVPQLELPRLMPFQRFLLLYLAAFGVLEGVRRAIPLANGRAVARDLAVATAISVSLVVVFATGAGPFSSLEQGLRAVPRSEGADGAELVAFREAIDEADSIAPEGTAVLVLGSRLSWHEQLWAPMEAPNRRFYDNDWLWYWHTRHAGPYDYHEGHFYPDPSQALTDKYLATHGIGAVVVTDLADRTTGASVRDAAMQSDLLESSDTFGAWDVYRVRADESLATLGDVPADAVTVSADAEQITATFDDAASGTVLVRQNWFPRWEAEVNGKPVPITRADNGYMEIPVDGGDVTVELDYAVTMMDTIARLVAIASIVAAIAAVLAPTPMARWARR